MNIKRIFALLLVLFGEALLIVSFLYFGQNVQSDILTLNIIVSSVIYGLLFVDIIFPWLNLKDKSQRRIGSLGIRWFFTFFYILIAIGIMIIFNTVKPINFTSQLIVHGILFFLLLLGFFMAFSSSIKVEEVYIEEKQNRNYIDEMKKITKEVQLKIDAMKDIPPDIISRLNDLQDSIRFLSPCNNNEAFGLEKKFIDEMKTLNNCFFNTPLNFDSIDENTRNCERTLKERKQLFSN